MSWNDGYERKKFNARIKKEIAEYKAAGMTEEQITAIVSLDEDQYRSERRYHMHTQEFCESDFDDDDGGDNGKSPLYEKYMEQLTVSFDDGKCRSDRYSKTSRKSHIKRRKTKMSHAMDREEFDEVIDAISQIQGKTIKLERALRLLKSKNPDSRLGYLYYEAFGDEPVSREEAIERMKKRIKLLGERKEQIIRHLETAFSDKNHNIRSYLNGDKQLKATNPTSGKVYPVVPSRPRMTLYYILVLEQPLNENRAVCYSDYKEIERYLRKDKSNFPKELFII